MIEKYEPNRTFTKPSSPNVCVGLFCFLLVVLVRIPAVEEGTGAFSSALARGPDRAGPGGGKEGPPPPPGRPHWLDLRRQARADRGPGDSAERKQLQRKVLLNRRQRPGELGAVLLHEAAWLPRRRARITQPAPAAPGGPAAAQAQPQRTPSAGVLSP